MFLWSKQWTSAKTHCSTWWEVHTYIDQPYIVSLLDVELDTALELTNLLYERLVLFVMECTNVFKLLDTKVTKKDC